jgi:hypothetical protein
MDKIMGKPSITVEFKEKVYGKEVTKQHTFNQMALDDRI